MILDCLKSYFLELGHNVVNAIIVRVSSGQGKKIGQFLKNPHFNKTHLEFIFGDTSLNQYDRVLVLIKIWLK